MPDKYDGFVTKVDGGWEAAANGITICVYREDEMLPAITAAYEAAVSAGRRVWMVKPDGEYEEIVTPF